MKMNRTEIKQQLQESVVEVTFTKVNGEQRIMTCTLKADILPPQIVTEEKKKLKKSIDVNEDVISVWDINAQGWRSFRIANVISFEKK